MGRFKFLEKKGFTGELANRVMYATMRSSDWIQMDLNILPEVEILERFIRNDPEVETEIRHMFSDVHGIVDPKESSLPWLRRIKDSGRRILYLSNYSPKIMRECADALYFLPEMDGGLFSCDMHLAKPEEAFYQALLEKYSLVPQQCVFIDDLRSNLETAERLGIHTVLFESQEQAERNLAKLLGI